MVGDEENMNDKEQLLSNFLNKLEEIHWCLLKNVN
jgi:hypothetical protein